MKKNLLYIVICCISLAGCDRWRDYRFKTKLSSAVALRAKGKYEDALLDANGALEIDSNAASAYIVRGKINISLNQYSFAIQDFSRAIELDPQNIMALYEKGFANALRGKYDTAAFYYTEAIQAKGSDTLYFEYNKKNPLKEEYDQNDVDMSIIKYCRGVAFYMTKNDDKALNDLEFCLSNGYNNAGSVFLYAGLIYMSKGFTAKGCNYFNLAVTNGNPDAQQYINKYCK